MHADQFPLVWPILAIVLLIVLITRLRLHPFLALILAAGFLGLTSAIPPVEVVKHFQKGFGDVLGSLGLVIGLGTMLGGLLLESGGGDKIATAFIGVGGRRSIPTAPGTSSRAESNSSLRVVRISSFGATRRRPPKTGTTF